MYSGTFHDLRKTYGSGLANNGVALHVIREMMGHTSIQTTADHYLTVDAAAADAVRAATRRTEGKEVSPTGSGEDPEKTVLGKVGRDRKGPQTLVG